MRIACAAFLALLLAAPAFAGGALTISVGLVVTGRFAPPLLGAWHSRTAARGGIYHFVVSGSSGAFYQLVSLPLRKTSPFAASGTRSAPIVGSCDLRVSGVIYSFGPISGQTSRSSADAPRAGSSYEMQYSVQSADVVTSSTDFDDCTDVAAAYLSDIPTTDSLILSSAGEDRLVDGATGAEYIRTR